MNTIFEESKSIFPLLIVLISMGLLFASVYFVPFFSKKNRFLFLYPIVALLWFFKINILAWVIAGYALIAMLFNIFDKYINDKINRKLAFYDEEKQLFRAIFLRDNEFGEEQIEEYERRLEEIRKHYNLDD